MPQTKRQNIKKLQQRASLPRYFRVGALVAAALLLLVVAIGFFNARNNAEFRMKSFPTELSTDVIAVVNGFERTETEGDVKKYYIKADRATTFADNHQEMENVYLQVFDETGERSDQITAAKAVYVPAENKNFTAYFAGGVAIETRDALKVKTEQVTYKKETETAEAEELIEFERENIKGKSLGAIVRIQEKKIELLKDVEIDQFEAAPGGEQLVAAQSDVKSAHMTANYAMLDQLKGLIELKENVFINIVPNGENANLQQPTDIKANTANAVIVDKQIKQIDLQGSVDVYQKPAPNNQKWTRTRAEKATAVIDKELKKLELFDNVHIETTQSSEKPTVVTSGYALYEKDVDRFNLKTNVHIVTVADARPTDIKANEAVYEQAHGKIFLTGSAEVAQGTDYIRGEQIFAELFPTKKLKYADAKGNAYLKQTGADRTTEVSARELNAGFNESNFLQAANAVGNPNAVLIPAKPDEYTRVTLSAPNAIRLAFKGEGLLEQMHTEGRTTVLLNAPNNSADAANKKLTADVVKTFFNANGKDLSKAEAIGNAELLVEPLRAAAENYRTNVYAPRFDCEFFPTGNNAKLCVGATKTKTVRTPTAPSADRGTQTLLADRLNASFNQNSNDVEQFDAAGNAKFSELDRNGISDTIVFTAADETVRLRGGEPTVWDDRARAKAAEIDWDTRREKSFLRGNASTTYYSQKSTGGATPFGATNKPVYVTAQEAEFNHPAETGLYKGNARAWQENNFVRSDTLLLEQKTGRLTSEGNVQSLLYDAKRRENGRDVQTPAYASSQKLTYNRENRLLRYENNVDIRQGTDRMVGGIANIYLNEKNEVSSSVLENNVVITQPKRRASGDYAQYNASDEIVILRGSPATVSDAESGSSQGEQMTVYLREDRVVGESKPKQGGKGRIRTVLKVKNN